MRIKIVNDLNEIYFVSDCHFNHPLMLKLRPIFKSVDEMNETIIKNWNQTIKKGVVFYLGDFALKCEYTKINSILRSLNGKIYFVNGNHDMNILESDKYKNCILEVVGKTHDYIMATITKDAHRKIALSHYCMINYEHRHHDGWHLFGHSHGSMNEFIKEKLPEMKIMDVGVDSIAQFLADKENRDIQKYDYRPISYLELKEYFSTKNTSRIDHHRNKNGN